MLSELGIKNRLFGSSLSKTSLGNYSICFSLFINKKESLIKVHKYIGFSLKNKKDRLDKVVGGENYIKNI